MISSWGPGASPIPTDKCATSRHWPGDCELGSMICTKRGRRKQRRLKLVNKSNKGRQTSTYNPHPSLDIVYLRLYQTPFWMFGLPGRVHFRTCTIGFRVLYFIVELGQIVRKNPNGVKIWLFLFCSVWFIYWNLNIVTPRRRVIFNFNSKLKQKLTWCSKNVTRILFNVYKIIKSYHIYIYAFFCYTYNIRPYYI